ncbi:hypothetical protein V6N13_143753 [Hibiscus sabdariffa]
MSSLVLFCDVVETSELVGDFDWRFDGAESCSCAGGGSLVGVCSVLEAELRGVAVGLRLAWDVGIRVVLLKVDNGDVARIIRDKARVSDLHGLVPTIRELVDRDWVVCVRQIRRLANMVSNGMEKLARSSYVSSLLDVGFVTLVFSMPPDEVLTLVHDDVSPGPGVA